MEMASIDLAVGTEQGIFFFAGERDGTFQPPVKTSTPFSVLRTFLGDFNGDGSPDLAMTGNGDLSVSIALGNGDGTFQAPLPFEATYFPRGFTAGDFNADGSFDLMQFSTSNTLSVSPQTASVWSSTPTVAFSTSRLDFGLQSVGTSSSPKSIVLTNIGNAPLSIAKVATTGNFAETNNCTSPLAVGRGCTLNVTFTPTASGTSNGSITFADNSSPGTQGLTLTGSGPADFSVSVAPSSNSVTAGNPASYALTLTPGGGFTGTVQLTCTGAPSQATCTLSESSVALDGSSAVTVKVTVTTTAPSVASLSRSSQVPLSGISFFHVLDDWPRAGSHSHADVSKKAASGGDNRDKCSCVGIDLLRRWEFRGRRRRIDSRYSAGHLQSDRIRNERELDAYHHDRSHRENLTPQNTCCHEAGQTDSSLGLASIEWCITVLRSGICSSEASEQIHCTNYVLRVIPESPDME